MNVDNLMQSISISEEGFDKLSDQFKHNKKIIKEFERRQNGDSESEELDDECILIPR
jgi:hypothetical protein